MQKNLKKLIASALMCAVLSNTPSSAVVPRVMDEFTNTFRGRAILDEDFLDPKKFPIADAERITQKITGVFKKYPNIAEKLVSHRPLVIKPFEIDGIRCPNAPEDSIELLSGVFRYKVEESADYLFIDVFDTHLVLFFMPDELAAYNELINAEIISLFIRTIVCDKHASEFETPNQTLPDKYFDEIKKEIIALAHTKYGYEGKGEILNGKHFNAMGKEINDSTITSREWLLGIISDTVNGTSAFSSPLRAAANDWLQQQ